MLRRRRVRCQNNNAACVGPWCSAGCLWSVR